jgi:hypothetical protein
MTSPRDELHRIGAKVTRQLADDIVEEIRSNPNTPYDAMHHREGTPHLRDSFHVIETERRRGDPVLGRLLGLRRVRPPHPAVPRGRARPALGARAAIFATGDPGRLVPAAGHRMTTAYAQVDAAFVTMDWLNSLDELKAKLTSTSHGRAAPRSIWRCRRASCFRCWPSAR